MDKFLIDDALDAVEPPLSASGVAFGEKFPFVKVPFIIRNQNGRVEIDWPMIVLLANDADVR